MTNKEWVNLIAKEFNCSNTMAKGMLHAMYKAHDILSVNKNVRRERKEKEEREKRTLEYYEWSEAEDYKYLNMQ